MTTYNIMPEHLAKAILEWFSEHLKGRLLCLSLSGSRAYGWATDIFDYDVWGLFDGLDWLDYIHSSSILAVDLNLKSLEHFKTHIFTYHSLEDLINMSNPFYQNDFDVYEIWNTLPPEVFNPHAYQLEFRDPSARCILYAFRSLLIPLYFLETGRVKLNCFEIKEEIEIKAEAFELACDWYLYFHRQAHAPSISLDQIYQMAQKECKEIEKRYEEALKRWKKGRKL